MAPIVLSRSRSGNANAERKPASTRDGGEPRPAPGAGAQVLVLDPLAGAVGVQAGPFLGLQLEDLQHPHRFAGRGHQAQLPVGGGEHHAGGGDAEQVHAPVGQAGQQVHHVVVVDQRVGHLYQRSDQGLLSRHRQPPLLKAPRRQGPVAGRPLEAGRTRS